MPGETTPELAHEAGVEFARRLLGDKYEAVICTHINKEHLHCHIVFNSVSFVDGVKYRNAFKDYFEDIRGISNEVSRKYGFSVIQPEGSGQHYAEWNAERSGKTTIRDLVRQDLDAAIAASFTFASLLDILRKRGYTVKYGSNVKYTAVKPPGGARFLRLDSLGEDYTEEASGRCIFTIYICCHRANGSRRKSRLKRGPKFAVRSSTGSNFSFCRSIT